MIRVNFLESEWEEGVTLEALLQTMRADEKNRYFFTDIVTVILNNVVIPASAHGSTVLCDGDEIRIYPLIAGG